MQIALRSAAVVADIAGNRLYAGQFHYAQFSLLILK